MFTYSTQYTAGSMVVNNILKKGKELNSAKFRATYSYLHKKILKHFYSENNMLFNTNMFIMFQ